MAAPVLVTTANGVCRLTFNRPAQRNAMSMEMLAAFYDNLKAADADPEIRCIVVDGAGEHFMAGGDIKSWAQLHTVSPQERGDGFRTRLQAAYPVVELIDALETPLIVAVQGYSVGAALGFVLAADFVIADESAKFTFANIRVGLVPDMGITYYLPRVVGERAALRLSLLGSQLDALQARDLGIVDEVVAPGAFEAAIASLTGTITAAPAMAIRRTKRLLHLSRHRTLSGQFAEEVESLALCAGEADFLEAVAAFSERRTPKFGGSS